MMKRKNVLLSILLSGVLILSACGKTASQTAGNTTNNDTIKIGYSALPSWYLWNLIEAKGFFKKHGVNVKLVWFPVYADSLSALNTGKIDANSQALLDSITPLDKGIKLKTIFITDNSAGGDGMIAQNNIKSIKDLKGKTIGTEIGTIEHFFMLTALKDAGLKESDVQFTNMAVPDAGNALIAGKLDAAGLWEPFLSKAVQKNTHKLVTSAQYPGLIADVLAASEDTANNKKAELQKVVDAWYDGLDYLSKHHAESVAIMAKKAGISTTELEEGLKGFKLFTPEENLAAFKKGNSYSSFYYTAEKNAEFLKKLGYIQAIPDFNGFADTTYLKNELKQAK